MNGQRDVYGSAARYAAAWRDAARCIPHLRVRQVQLTLDGRQAVNSASAGDQSSASIQSYAGAHAARRAVPDF